MMTTEDYIKSGDLVRVRLAISIIRDLTCADDSVAWHFRRAALLSLQEIERGLEETISIIEIE